MNKPKVIDMSGAAIIARLNAIEARQREYGMHDPGCPARWVERANQENAGPYYTPRKCTCWLSE